MTTRRTLALTGLFTVAYALISSLGDNDASVVAIDVLSAAAVVLAWWGALRQPARGRLAWTMSAVGLSLWLVGDFLWDWNVITHGAAPSVSIADAAYLAGYPAFVFGIVTMIRQRASKDWRAGFLDATGVGLAAGLAAWIFLVPALGPSPGLEAAVTIAYPLGDVVLLAALTWLVLAPGIRGLPSALALSGIATTLVLDVTQSVEPLAANATLARWLDNAYPLAYVLLALAACHERSAELTIPDPAPDERLHTGRIVFLGSALFAGPMIDTFSRSPDPTDRLLITGTTVVIGAIVLYRFVGALREVERARAAISAVAGTDPLTGIDNRRRFLAGSERSIERLTRDGGAAGVLMIDIDHFKQINDTYGHAAGDAVLAELARRANLAIRPHDLLGRLGGDEFAIVLPEADGDATTRVATRLQRLVAERPFLLPDTGDMIVVTLSIGAAAGRFDTVHEALAEADAALYEAKRRGRDRMWLGEPDSLVLP